jgi:hypothetical protein
MLVLKGLHGRVRNEANCGGRLLKGFQLLFGDGEGFELPQGGAVVAETGVDAALDTLVDGAAEVDDAGVADLRVHR